MRVFQDRPALPRREIHLGPTFAGSEPLPGAVKGSGDTELRRALLCHEGILLPMCCIAQTPRNNTTTVKLPGAPQRAETKRRCAWVEKW